MTDHLKQRHGKINDFSDLRRRIEFFNDKAHLKTGVEMEAIMGVNAALITIYDLSKIVNPDLLIQDIRLLVKQGGKSGLWINPNGVPEFLSHLK